MSDDLLTEFDFPLVNGFDFANSKGEQDEAVFIKIYAPSTKNSRECGFLKQAFFRSIPDQDTAESKEASEDKEGNITGDGLMAMLAMSEKVDYADCLDVGKKLFASGIAKVNDDVKVTSHIIQQMSEEDFESMLGEFMANFTVASALRKMNAATSKASSTS